MLKVAFVGLNLKINVSGLVMVVYLLLMKFGALDKRFAM